MNDLFYWSYKHKHVVLSNEEEVSLVRNLANSNAADIIGYDTNLQTRRVYEKRINKFLQDLTTNNPKEFEKYYFRSCYDKEAQKVFYLLIDGYGRVTKNAVLGKYFTKGNDYSKIDSTLEDMLYSSNGIEHKNIIYISFLCKRLLPFPRYVVTNYISFTEDSIRKVVGCVTDFVVMTDTMNIKFTENYIRISVLGKEE